jgi:hypothetical protein
MTVTSRIREWFTTHHQNGTDHFADAIDEALRAKRPHTHTDDQEMQP